MLGLVVLPVAIAQYPDFFNRNVWVLPLSIIAVLLCWIFPLLLHSRTKAIYEYVATIPKLGLPLFALLVMLLVGSLFLGGRKLLRFHKNHLRRMTIEESQQAKNEPAPTVQASKKNDTDTEVKSTAQPTQQLRSEPESKPKAKAKPTPTKSDSPSRAAVAKPQMVQYHDLTPEECKVVSPFARQFATEHQHDKNMYLGVIYWAATFIPWLNEQLANGGQPFRLAEPDITGGAGYRLNGSINLNIENGEVNGAPNGIVANNHSTTPSTITTKNFKFNAGPAGLGYIRIDCLEELPQEKQ
ncbi:MAG: hypothetical protein WBM04_12360 [Candidatus Korobacteraceae bacterium]